MTLFFNILHISGLLILVLLIFNLIILVHELGHFLAARWRGLVVEKFAIWFGKPLWSKTIKGVEYRLGSIPAGGYVMLPQLASMESIEGKAHSDKAQLPPASPLDKIIVAIAGPLFSFLLAILFAFIVWGVGRAVPERDRTTTIGFVKPDSPAEQAGLKPGDVILSVDGHHVKQFGGMVDSVIWSVVSSRGESIEFVVRRNGKELTLNAMPVIEPRRGLGRSNLRQVGIEGKATPLVASVTEGSAFAKAGLRAGDLITHLNGEPLYSWRALVEGLTGDPQETVTLTIQRGEGAGDTSQVTVAKSWPGVASVIEKSPAKEGGLKDGDKILSVAGQIPRRTADIIALVEASVGEPVPFVVERDGQRLELSVTPRKTKKGEIRIGIVFGNPDGLALRDGGPIQIIKQDPIEQIRISLQSMANTLGALFAPKSSIKAEQLSGPVGIVSSYLVMLMSPEGWRYALWFSVFLNVNLAILNMLPFPVLDGGHILLSLFEMIRRRPLNVRLIEILQTSFALLLIALMLFLTFNDVLDIPRWFGFDSGPDAMEFEAKPDAKDGS